MIPDSQHRNRRQDRILQHHAACVAVGTGTGCVVSNRHAQCIVRERRLSMPTEIGWPSRMHGIPVGTWLEHWNAYLHFDSRLGRGRDQEHSLGYLELACIRPNNY